MIYLAIIGLCLWLILSFWAFLGRGYSGLVLTAASLFIAVAVAIQILLWRISRWTPDGPSKPTRWPRFAEWLEHDFEERSGRQRGADAAVEVLLPIAAVAIG